MRLLVMIILPKRNNFSLLCRVVLTKSHMLILFSKLTPWHADSSITYKVSSDDNPSKKGIAIPFYAG